MNIMKDFLHRAQFLRMCFIRQERRVYISIGTITFFLAIAGCTTLNPDSQSQLPQNQSNEVSITDTPQTWSAIAPELAQRVSVGVLSNPPPLASGSEILAGGFSGLSFDHRDAEGNLYFWTITDRGPNGKDYQEGGIEYRPFLIPTFQPQIYLLKLNAQTKTLAIIESRPLQLTSETAVSGLPNIEENLKTIPNRLGDEIPVDLNKEVIALDLMGIDSEGICRDKQKNFWVAEEYRPSILKFSEKGQLIRRYVPQQSFSVREIQKIDQEIGENLVLQTLPEIYKTHKKNRGFEGIACTENKIYAILQSPLPNEKEIRILEFDPQLEEVTQEFLYPLETPDIADKIGDLTYFNGAFFSIEQNGKTDEKAFRKIFRFELPVANIRSKKSKNFETSDWPSPIAKTFVSKKTEIIDLVKYGFASFEKIEGLSFIEADHIAIVNDNDFDVPRILSKKKGSTAISILATIELSPKVVSDVNLKKKK